MRWRQLWLGTTKIVIGCGMAMAPVQGFAQAGRLRPTLIPLVYSARHQQVVGTLQIDADGYYFVLCDYQEPYPEKLPTMSQCQILSPQRFSRGDLHEISQALTRKIERGQMLADSKRLFWLAISSLGMVNFYRQAIESVRNSALNTFRRPHLVGLAANLVLIGVTNAIVVHENYRSQLNDKLMTPMSDLTTPLNKNVDVTDNSWVVFLERLTHEIQHYEALSNSP